MDDPLKAGLLLLASNAFLTAAWYGHLKFKKAPLLIAIVASWEIAFFEYCLQVPAHRVGYRVLSGYQLKLLHEGLSLLVFMVFAAVRLGEGFQPKYLASFGPIVAAVGVAFR